MKERLPRHHEDAVVVGRMSSGTSCVFAFGPDCYYEAVLGTSSRSGDIGCTLIRKMDESELKKSWVK